MEKYLLQRKSRGKKNERKLNTERKGKGKKELWREGELKQ